MQIVSEIAKFAGHQDHLSWEGTVAVWEAFLTARASHSGSVEAVVSDPACES